MYHVMQQNYPVLSKIYGLSAPDQISSTLVSITSHPILSYPIPLHGVFLFIYFDLNQNHIVSKNTPCHKLRINFDNLPSHEIESTSINFKYTREGYNIISHRGRIPAHLLHVLKV